MLRGDERLIKQILVNLLSNAVKFTLRGGTISLDVVCETDGGVAISVVDTGIGIAPEHLPHVFEEYYQVGNRQRDRSNGLGLGLAIVRRLEKLLGYRMTLDSTPGAGSRFSFVVPAAATASPDAMISVIESA
jgi:signal transduction histidine kinase